MTPSPKVPLVALSLDLSRRPTPQPRQCLEVLGTRRHGHHVSTRRLNQLLVHVGCSAQWVICMLVVGQVPAPANLGGEPGRTSPGSYVVHGPESRRALFAAQPLLRGLSRPITPLEPTCEVRLRVAATRGGAKSNV